MSEADKMFEKIKYKKVIDDKDRVEFEIIAHIRDEDNEEQVGRERIYFDKKREQIIIDSDFYFQVITMQELKAINKKCKELGWI